MLKNRNHNRAIAGIIAAASIHSLSVCAAETVQDTVDFRYSPPEWQTAICLPDSVA